MVLQDETCDITCLFCLVYLHECYFMFLFVKQTLTMQKYMLFDYIAMFHVETVLPSREWKDNYLCKINKCVLMTFYIELYI